LQIPIEEGLDENRSVKQCRGQGTWTDFEATSVDCSVSL